MYLDTLNDNMVGYANISARYMLDHLFETYGNITAVNLAINFEHMRRAWDPQQPVETLVKHIQDCAHYSEAGGVLIGHLQQINVGYAKIFVTGYFMIACRPWNEKPTAGKTWAQFKSHFAAAHRQHKQMQGESAATSGYHSANAAVNQTEYQMAEATIGALLNLETATAAYRGGVATLTQANSHLAKQLEDNSSELRKLKALLDKERRENRGPRLFNPLAITYCCNHGYKVGSTDTSLTYRLPKPGHKTEATRSDNMGKTPNSRQRGIVRFEAFFTANEVEYQLVPYHCHRRNATERAIRSFEEHFVAGLSSVDPTFPLHLWDRLLPQAETT
jgi:hypothetical protein